MTTFPIPTPLRAEAAGLFVSSGVGTHPDRVMPSWELIFVREGVLDIAEGDRPFSVGAGEALLLWPGRRHFGTRPYPPNLSFFWIHFRADGAPTTGEECLDLPRHTHIPRPDHLASLFRRYLDDQESGMLGAVDAHLLLGLMLCEVARPQAQDRGALGAPAVLAHRAHSIIHRRVSEPLGSSDIARELRCNPDYLGRVFRQEYGETVTEAIHRTKLRFACRLLVEENETVDRVARRCGFPAVGHFRRVFKRHEGMTPLAYRRLYARTNINIR